MMHQVDLHTADIDILNALTLQAFDRRDGGFLIRVEIAFSFCGDRLRPGNTCPVGSVPATGFCQ